MKDAPAMHSFRHIGLLSFLFLLPVAGWLGAGSPALAQGGFGDITVTPTRVVLEGRERSGTISLANTGAEKATYRISVVNMRMTENGAFVEIPEGQAGPGEQFAGDLFRYAPRQVTLEPGTSQTIRIALRKPAGLAAGEYRSHLLIRAIPGEGAGRSIEQKAGNGVEISLAVIPGIALPVIVRHGEVTASVTMSNFVLDRTPASKNGKIPSLTFRLNRDGNESVYGDLAATYFAPGNDKGVLLSEVNQLAVYTPNSYRIVTMSLNQNQEVKLESGGKIKVTYRTQPKEGAKPIGAGEFVIP